MASNNFINECKTPAYDNRLGKIVIDGVEYNQSNYLTNLEIDNNIYNNGTIIGNTYTKGLTFSLINVNKDTEFVGKKVIPSVGVVYDDESTEYIDFDEFTIESLNDEQTKNFTNITGYDSLNILDTKYECGLTNAPHTIGEYWADLVDGLGLETNTTTFTNSSIVIPYNPFVNNETNRVVLSEIEKVSCTYSKITKVNGQNYIDLYWLDLNGNPVYEFDTNDYSNLEGSLTKYGPVNCVILGNPDVGGENVYLQDDESIAQNGETKIVINADYFLYTQSLREQAIQGIYNKLLGFEYYDLSLTTYYGKPFLEVGDKIRVNTSEENVYDTYILQHTFTYDGTFKSVIKSPSFTKQEEVVKSTESISSKVKRTELMVDKANQTITALVEDVSEVKVDIDDLENSIVLFSVDLSKDSLIIPVDTYQKPYTTITYGINYYGYFKGEQIIPTVSITGSQTGITTSTTSALINFAVDSSVAINNKDYTYNLTFTYTSEGVIYTLYKKISVVLALQGAQGPAGQDGTDGSDGTSSYFYVRYSKNASGNPMVETPTSETEYMGVASTTSPTAPTSYSAYTWSKIKGEQGLQGIRGPAGEDGLPSYLHIKWSKDGINFTPADETTGTPEGKTPDKWQGTYTDNNPVDSNVFSDYTWNDTSIYVQDSLNQLDSKIDGVDGRIGDVETDLHNNYYTNEDVDSIVQGNTDQINAVVSRVTTLELDKDSFNVDVQKVIDDYGVSKIETTTGYRFDENGLNISKTGSDIQNLIDNTGMYVNHSGVEMLGIDSTGGRMENLTVRKYLTMGTNSRFEDYQGTRTGCFYIGGES